MTGRRGGKGPSGRGKGPSGRGTPAVRVRGRGRKTSSTRWLQRQLNDPYVRKAQHLGLRSRAAFKLLELDDRFHFLKRGGRVLDLGAAPGGWTQVAVDRVGVGKDGGGRVIAVDPLKMDPVAGADFLELDFLDADAPAVIREALGGPADVVMSDMAASSTGHAGTDHLRIMALCEAALHFAEEVLAPGGVFIAKVLRGGTEQEMLARMKRRFASVRHVKPPASRADSAEIYVVALGYRGGG